MTRTVFILAGCLLAHFGIAVGTYYIHHQCFYEEFDCRLLRYINCTSGTTIQVIWSRVGFSSNWSSATSYTECNITDPACYGDEVSEPSDDCTGQQACRINVCSNETFRQPNMGCGPEVTNFVRINYTCVAPTTTTASPSTSSGAITTPPSTPPSGSTIPGGGSSTVSGYPSTSSSGEGGDSGGPNIGAIIGIVVGVVIIVVVLGVLVGKGIIPIPCGKKNRVSPGDGYDPETRSIDPPEDRDGIRDEDRDGIRDEDRDGIRDEDSGGIRDDEGGRRSHNGLPIVNN